MAMYAMSIFGEREIAPNATQNETKVGTVEMFTVPKVKKSQNKR